MRISDWSSDVCSSDLMRHPAALGFEPGPLPLHRPAASARPVEHEVVRHPEKIGASVSDRPGCQPGDRKSVVSGKSVSVRVDLGGSRTIKKKNHHDRKQSV